MVKNYLFVQRLSSDLTNEVLQKERGVVLEVTTLNQENEMLTDFHEVSIFQELSGQHTLEFTVVKTERNKHVYDMVQEESTVKVGKDEFVVKLIDENPYSKSVYATGIFFEMIDDYVEETFPDGLYTITEALDLALSNSVWTYELMDSYPQRAKLEGFGNDNALSMLRKVINAFNSEYEVDANNKKIIIKRSVGINTDYQIRYKSNLVGINRNIDSSNVKTAIKVFYNLDEFGNYNSSIVYRSPNVNKYPREKWATPILSDVITTESQAVSTARLVLNDEPTIAVEVEFLALKKIGYESDDIQLGNRLFLIDERMNIDANARIVAVKTFPYEISRTPVVTISSIRKNMSSLVINQQNAQATIEQSAVKLKSIYNGCTISKEDGFKAVAENGVETVMNATEGIYIKRDDVLKFFVDANNDELTMDGRLKVTSGSTTVMEGYKDTAGGIIKLYDVDAQLNVAIGSNRNDIGYTGGSLTLYNDGSQLEDGKVELRIDRSSEGGVMALVGDGNLQSLLAEAKNSFTNESKLTLTGQNIFDTTTVHPDFIETTDGTYSTTISSEDVTIRNVKILREIGLIWDAINNL